MSVLVPTFFSHPFFQEHLPKLCAVDCAARSYLVKNGASAFVSLMPMQLVTYFGPDVLLLCHANIDQMQHLSLTVGQRIFQHLPQQSKTRRARNFGKWEHVKSTKHKILSLSFHLGWCRALQDPFDIVWCVIGSKYWQRCHVLKPWLQI